MRSARWFRVRLDNGIVMPLWMSRDRVRCWYRRDDLGDDLLNGAGEVSLEAAHGLPLGQSLGGAPK
ncbi:hypothetical protein GCM10022629_65470 [Amorphoplanes auranticolor]